MLKTETQVPFEIKPTTSFNGRAAFFHATTTRAYKNVRNARSEQQQKQAKKLFTPRSKLDGIF